MIGSCLRTIGLRRERHSSANPSRHQPGGKTRGDQDGFTDDRWAATFGGGRHPYRAAPRAASSGSVPSPFLLTIRYHDLLADPASAVIYGDRCPPGGWPRRTRAACCQLLSSSRRTETELDTASGARVGAATNRARGTGRVGRGQTRTQSGHGRGRRGGRRARRNAGDAPRL